MKFKEQFAKYLTPLKTLWERLPLLGKVVLGLLGIGLIGVSAYLVVGTGPGPMSSLYDAPLELAQAAQVREFLESKRVPYRIASEGMILVPTDQKLALRMELASEGLQPTTSTGFELFDEQRFGASEFEQRINFRRALEGELSRTINTLEAVESSRVHLNMPRRSLFREEDVAPSASVVLKLRRGAVLTSKRVIGIQELVARSVERLEPAQVAVLDEQGRLLNQDENDAGGTAALDIQVRYERQLEQRVEEILQKTIGEGHAVVRVAADFDFSRVEEVEERYDPDQSVVRSEQLVNESQGNGADQPGGIPGVRSNLPGGPEPVNGASGELTTRSSETRNYEVDKVVRRVQRPVAQLKRQSVAVLVDGHQQGEGQTKSFVPRDQAELDQLAVLVKRAVGFDATRGDAVDVQSMPFAPGEDDTLSGEGETTTFVWPVWAPWVAAAAVALLAVALLAMALRRRRQQTFVDHPRTVKELEAELAAQLQTTALAQATPTVAAPPPEARLQEGLETFRREVLTLASKDSDAAVRVLKTWLAEDPLEKSAGRER
jgi:flagellar M-ring protein FliF